MSTEHRLLSIAERGLAAQSLVESDLVEAFFAEHRKALIAQMLSAETGDDAARRNAAIEIRILDSLKNHLGLIAGSGRKAFTEIERRKAQS